MSEINLLTANSEAEKRIVERLKNREQLQRARIHPFNVLVALETYKQGQGFKGKLTWNVSDKIKNALEEAFYLSFKFVKPTNQRYLLALMLVVVCHVVQLMVHHLLHLLLVHVLCVW